METAHNLLLGFSVALSGTNLLFCFIGALLGTLIGVLPGIGPLATVAMLLPVTFQLDPTAALVMLAGIYYGAQYGGSTTAILVNLPGESSSVITCLDGYQMARQGRAGSALAIAALGSLFAGCVSTLVIALFSAPLTALAQQFRPADYCGLMTFGLVAAVILARGSPLKAVAMVMLGLLLGLVGTDVNSGTTRYIMKMESLADGIGFVGVAMGLFGLAEIIKNLEEREHQRAVMAKIERLWPTLQDMKDSWRPVLRGTAVGSFLGVLPGGGALLSSFAAYTLEKRVSRTPERFGRGAIEGVASAESANNAGAQTSFIPLLTLGIPSNALIALMAGAMMMHGITPGPQVMTRNPDVYWGLIASMWIGNLMLVVINLPLIGVWVSLLKVPYRLLYLGITMFCCIGAYSLNNSVFDIQVAAVFAVLGYIFIKLDCEPAPLILGFILGPLLEENLRRAMLLSQGDWSVFVTQPISATFLLLSLVLAALIVVPNVRKTREAAFVAD
ncbi:tripartite tricarboxylate transporter permease [Bosea caraganae]|uniref:Tripartite tricarboxylate transporter permease n=1 Tax=Bosea caraganae TaxID=2763117 RepID=A0A370KZC1_9HYPH|nr:tripartite tricarboxylate transporter permease [Bosea caraganae]RDJ20359.1 tripartite tricarboxylate transporter permease [Bosea caraganae]RDJ26560.1 tripartite tricarboxylate transporter permease [Bosea caraganae]